MKKLLLLLLLSLPVWGQAVPGNQSIVALGVQGSSLPNFSVTPPPQPVVTASTVSGTLAAGQYSVRLAFNVTATVTPTLPSVSTLATLTAAGTLNIASPTCPSGVANYNVYIGTAVGNETQQGSATTCGTAFAQSSSLSAGAALPSFVVVPIQLNVSGQQIVVGPGAGAADPCSSNGVAKSSAVINLTSATTTQLVALSGTTTVFVCGVTVTIDSATSATTLLFEYGTGASCGTGTTSLTGAFNTGGATAAGSVVLSFADPGTTFKTPAGNALCAVTAGTTVNVQGVLTYVQQ